VAGSFGVCLAVALSGVVAAALVTETRCRSVRRTEVEVAAR